MVTNVVYVPLDERPCNNSYPQEMARLTDMQIKAPPKHLLGSKKNPANRELLRDWILESILDAQYLVVSLDMLVYGGIVPSRVHHRTFAECMQQLDLLRQIKRRNPNLKVYAFNLIMRVPNNKTSEEEPDYYATHGPQIYRYSWLKDKYETTGLDEAEEHEYKNVTEALPMEVLNDYLGRRRVNSRVNLQALDLVADGTIDYLNIPLDDNSEYGFSAAEQRTLTKHIVTREIYDRVMIYPGADELGFSQLARVFAESKQRAPRIYIHYSSTMGPFMRPKYEDRTLNESIRSQIVTSGARMAVSPECADAVLMVHSPATEQGQMAEQVPFEERHRSYASEINYHEFTAAIQSYLDSGYPVAIADVAVCNGSDHVLMSILSRKGLLPSISAYAGWNTAGNTLGTVVAIQTIKSILLQEGSPEGSSAHLDRIYVRRLIEDWGYQSIVRNDLKRKELPSVGATYYDFKGNDRYLEKRATQRLTEFAEHYLPQLNRAYRPTKVTFPWNRLFEVEFDVVETHDVSNSDERRVV